MKRFFLSLVLIAGLLVAIPPLANAETLTFNCGGGGTYSVIMPQGIALDGSKCSGAVTLDSKVRIIEAAAFQMAKGLVSIIIPNTVVEIRVQRLHTLAYKMLLCQTQSRVLRDIRLRKQV